MKNRTTIFMAVLIGLGLALSATAQKDCNPYGTPVKKAKNKSGPSCGNTDIPNYITPGNFEKALKLSKKTNKPLLIKGVAFGMNKTGAKNPTKGNW